MRDWFHRNLGDAMVAFEPLARIEALYRAGHDAGRDPDDVAVFIRYESEGRLHCEVEAYFSPAAAAIAREMGASPCGRPAKGGLSLHVGAADAWTTLFPREAGR
jgi:hypothetical protein